MADTNVYLIDEARLELRRVPRRHHPARRPGGKDPSAPVPRSAPADMDASFFPEHKAFEAAVADLGARVVGGAALQSSRHGGTVKPGAATGSSRMRSTPTARSRTPPR